MEINLSNLKEWIKNGGMEEQIKRYNVPKNEQHAQRWGTLFDYLTENNLGSMLEHASDIVEKYESGQDVLSFLDGIERGRAVAEKEGPSLDDIIQGKQKEAEQTLESIMEEAKRKAADKQADLTARNKPPELDR